MKYCVIFLAVVLSDITISAQNPESKPEDTEVWKPVPEVIAPGKTDNIAKKYGGAEQRKRLAKALGKFIQ